MPNDKTEVSLTAPIIHTQGAYFAQLGPHTVKIAGGKLYVLRAQTTMNTRGGVHASEVTGYEWIEAKDVA